MVPDMRRIHRFRLKVAKRAKSISSVSSIFLSRVVRISPTLFSFDRLTSVCKGSFDGAVMLMMH